MEGIAILLESVKIPYSGIDFARGGRLMSRLFEWILSHKVQGAAAVIAAAAGVIAAVAAVYAIFVVNGPSLPNQEANRETIARPSAPPAASGISVGKAAIVEEQPFSAGLSSNILDSKIERKPFVTKACVADSKKRCKEYTDAHFVHCNKDFPSWVHEHCFKFLLTAVFIPLTEPLVAKSDGTCGVEVVKITCIPDAVRLP